MMPCRTYRSADGKVNVFICGRRPTRKCALCDRPSEVLCDFPVKGKTCDKPCCRQHAKRVGEDRDYCVEHALADSASKKAAEI